ncbi:MAG: hypothetical protein O3A14_21010 [Cyanobacteria bacterium]|nr:hypothetical protein [Cyanobacteriota bacterium]
MGSPFTPLMVAHPWATLTGQVATGQWRLDASIDGEDGNARATAVATE